MSKNSFFSKPVIHKQKIVKDFGLGKNHKVNVESNIIMPILAESIYKRKISFMRELYNNEKTAAYKAKKAGLKNQRIEIRLDTNTRDLTITGFNTIGISKDVFQEIILNVGVSGNNSKENIGMFGLGLYSFSLSSENCIIITYSFEDKEHYSYLGKSALNFEEIEPQEKLKEFGTKFYLNLKDDIDLYDLKKEIEAITKFSDIPTLLFIDDEKHDLTQYNNIMQYFKTEIYNKASFNESIVYKYINNDDYEVIFYNKSSPRLNSYYSGNNNISLLLNTPIELDSYFYHGSFILNIKNEHKFTPHISRDFYEEQSRLKIERIIRDFTGYEGIDKEHTDLKSWYDDKLKWFNVKFKDTEKYNLRCKNTNNFRTKRPVNFYHVLPQIMPKKLWVSTKSDKRLFDKLKANNELIVFCDDYYFEDFKKIGFKEYQIKKADIINKSKTKITLTKSFKFWFRGLSYNEYRESFKKVVKTSDLNNDKYNLRYSGFRSNVALITDRADYKNAITKDDILETLKNTIFTTSKGLKTFEFIQENINDIQFIVNEDKDEVINQKGLMIINSNLPHTNYVLVNNVIYSYLILMFGKMLNRTYLNTHYEYFKAIFNGKLYDILESIQYKADKIEFYDNMKYLRDAILNDN